MGMLDQNSAIWTDELESYVQHAHIDTHISSCMSSALEVDELLLSSRVAPQAHDDVYFAHNQMALRLGIIA